MKEILFSPEKNEWMKAMENEIDSLHTNKVWDLAELACWRKAISSKEIFKRKYDVDGHMEQLKARMVAQRTVRYKRNDKRSLTTSEETWYYHSSKNLLKLLIIEIVLSELSALNPTLNTGQVIGF